MPTPTRIKLKNILFATDFSPSAEAILPHALDVARRYGAVLYTVHVLLHRLFVEVAQPNPEQIRLMASQRMPAFVRSESWKDVKHKELIEQGEVSEVLSKLGRKYGIDLIVMGTGGRKGLGKLLLGSVAEEVFRNAECPVLTVGPHVTRWRTEGKLQHILFATDFGPESLHGLPYAISLAEKNRALLTILHVAPETGVGLFLDDPKEVTTSTEKQLRALIPRGTRLWHEPEYRVEFGSPAETILRVAATTVDMIVLGVKRAGALTKHLGEGVAYKVVCEAPCRVLSVGARYHA